MVPSVMEQHRSHSFLVLHRQMGHRDWVRLADTVVLVVARVHVKEISETSPGCFPSSVGSWCTTAHNLTAVDLLAPLPAVALQMSTGPCSLYANLVAGSSWSRHYWALTRLVARRVSTKVAVLGRHHEFH